ncbi:hypothetical protein K2173_009831 [Erythroxylum novogranatense]|uniref:Ubiquitin-like domain-containing protein n=1 Tax=Erythroxylum novogranatense TaxID=1862640 RepID=A0AAV8SZ23_9ROSI|nr:hypothetical protein K2173_009831 [Erythroxylum novogranatense]
MSVKSRKIRNLTIKLTSTSKSRVGMGMKYFSDQKIHPLKKAMNASCDRRSVELNSIAFLFDGRRLEESKLDELEMEDGDEIDAMLHSMVALVESKFLPLDLGTSTHGYILAIYGTAWT